MGKYLKKILIGTSCYMCAVLIFLASCSSKPWISTNNTSPGGIAIVAIALLPIAPFIMAKNTLEEMAQNNRRKNERENARNEKALAYCPEGYSDFCYNFGTLSQSIDYKRLLAELEKKKPLPLDDPRTNYMLWLLATDWHSSQVEISALAQPLSPSSSRSDMLIRTALLRGTLNTVWHREEFDNREVVTDANDDNYWELLRTTNHRNPKESENFQKAEAEFRYMIEAKLRARPVPPNPAYLALAARLLEIDETILVTRPDQALDAEDELVFAMDSELIARFGPESEFQHWADKAQKHYLNVIRKTRTQLALVALIRYDKLARSEAQRLTAVRLLIKNIPPEEWPNSGSDNHLSDLSWYELTAGRELQPAMEEWIEVMQWYSGWAVRLDSILQMGRENKEISELLAKAYPVGSFPGRKK